jgi:hypothetical protein
MIKGILEITPTGLAGDLLMLPRSEQVTRKDFTICDKHLVDRGMHLFIASQRWEELIINIHPTIDTRFILPIASKAKKVTLKFHGAVNDNILNLVCGLYPDKTGKLRRYFMLGKDISEVLREE